MKPTKPVLFFFLALLVALFTACAETQTGNKSNSSTVSNHPQKTKTPIKIATLRPTSTPLPTRKPTEIPGVNFDLSGANTILPKDIFEEVAYYGQGGDPTQCDYSSTEPVVCDTPDQVEYLMPVEVRSVGWKIFEPLQVAIAYPDGRVENQSFTVDDFPVSFIFKPAFDDPLGDYQFTFTGNSGTVTTSISYIKPGGPRLLPIDETHILLYGFSARESVKLFCYIDHTFAGWQSIAVDQTGNQVVKVDAGQCQFAALSQSGKEVHLLGVENADTEQHWGHSIKRTNCGGLFSRLFVHRLASVAFTDGSNMRLRAQPGFSQSVLAKVPEGTRLDILDGPVCADNSTWWNVLVLSGGFKVQSGWMTEEQNGTYLLQPEDY